MKLFNYELYLILRSNIINIKNYIVNTLYPIIEIKIQNNNNNKIENITYSFIYYLFISNIIYLLNFIGINIMYPSINYKIIQITKKYKNTKYNLIISNNKFKNILDLNQYYNNNINKIHIQIGLIITDYCIYNNEGKYNIKELIIKYKDKHKLFDHTLENIFIMNNVNYSNYKWLSYTIYDISTGAKTAKIPLLDVLNVHINDIYNIK
jgi:hypothetical protein